MQIEQLLQLDEFRLPAINASTHPYVEFAKRKIDDYISHIRRSSLDLFLDSPLQLGSYGEFVSSIEELGNGLIKVIELSKSINSHLAYPEFHKLMDSAGIFLTGHKGAFFSIKPDEFYYRCKFDDKDTSLRSQGYFFHAPFEINDHVGNTRFAPAGFPAIYLANSVIGGYQETRSTSLIGFQGVKFQTTKGLSFLDIDFNKPAESLKLSDPKEYYMQLQAKGLIYPLLLCCYSQKRDSVAASQEYIIPQLLLRWVKETGGFLFGIKYSSTLLTGPNYKGVFYNLIIPPIEVKNEGYCPKLKKLFKMSNVCGFVQDQLTMNTFYATNFPAVGFVNEEIEAIEWSSAQENYDINEVGKMEFYLRHGYISEDLKF